MRRSSAAGTCVFGTCLIRGVALPGCSDGELRASFQPELRKAVAALRFSGSDRHAPSRRDLTIRAARWPACGAAAAPARLHPSPPLDAASCLTSALTLAPPLVVD